MTKDEIYIFVSEFVKDSIKNLDSKVENQL